MSVPLLWDARAELAVAGDGDGDGRPDTGYGEQGTEAKDSARSYRRNAGPTQGSVFVGAVAVAPLRVVCAQVQRARRAGAADIETCRRANKCTGIHTGALTTTGDEWTAAKGSGTGV